MSYRPQYVGCVRTKRVHHVYSRACWQRVLLVLRKTRVNNDTYGLRSPVVTIRMYDDNVCGIVIACFGSLLRDGKSFEPQRY